MPIPPRQNDFDHELLGTLQDADPTPAPKPAFVPEDIDEFPPAGNLFDYVDSQPAETSRPPEAELAPRPSNVEARPEPLQSQGPDVINHIDEAAADDGGLDEILRLITTLRDAFSVNHGELRAAKGQISSLAQPLADLHDGLQRIVRGLDLAGDGRPVQDILKAIRGVAASLDSQQSRESQLLERLVAVKAILEQPNLSSPTENVAIQVSRATSELQKVAAALGARAEELAQAAQPQTVTVKNERGIGSVIAFTVIFLLGCAGSGAGGYLLTGGRGASSPSQAEASNYQSFRVAFEQAGNKLEWFKNCPANRTYNKSYCIFNITGDYTVPR